MALMNELFRSFRNNITTFAKNMKNSLLVLDANFSSFSCLEKGMEKKNFSLINQTLSERKKNLQIFI